ncbi:hypothetical protein MCCC1A01412_26995 [Bacillus anthracis]|uniref:hypothetical protein n=1 Tax=Bacillus anthracis TaxID=1392 RepID=UPI0008FE476A|nr:hypothetical protein [Bacillus anthracis]AXO94307.1 hypothetical protein DY471_18675 [Bacillus anthracis]OJD83402.1 hypothetical protein MCCC1A01412_26995 [Bacillus anthracis]
MNKDIQFLKELQQELKTQDNDCQASPRYWALMDYKWVITAEGEHERTTIFFIDDCEASPLDEYVEDILNEETDEEYTDEQIEELKDAHEYGSEDEVFDWIKENVTNECYLVYEREESFIVPNTMFLTKEEAKRHIELNHYHYTSKVHTYAMTAWRAPKVERLLNILETFDWELISTK